MPTPAIVRSDEARSDFRRLHAWIAHDAGKARARAVLARLNHGIDRLAKRPRLGRRRMDFAGEPYGFTVAPWIILYQPLPNDAGIVVLRIIDSRRDVVALLGKKT